MVESFEWFRASIMSLSTSWLLAGGGLLFFLALLTLGKVPLGYNIRNLAVRWPTTLLTAAAFTLVVGLLTVMLAFVNGMYRLTEGSGQPGNVIVLSDGATDELVSNLGYSDAADIERQPGVLRDAAGNPMCSREVYVVVNQPLPEHVKGAARRRFVQVRGIEDPVLAGMVHGLPLLPGGKWFSQAGVETLAAAGEATQSETREGVQAIQAVVGQGVAGTLGADLGKPSLEVGDLFDLGGRKWIVVGLMQTDGSAFGSEIWAKRTIVGPMFGKETLTSLILRTKDAAAAKALATDLTTNFKKTALQAQTETEYFAKLSETNKQFLYAIIMVAVFMALGGALGVMNTMFAAIGQRIKDIGVMRILGFARWQVLVSFLLESLLIAMIGGAIGCALGLFADGLTASSIVSGGPGGGGKFVVLKLVVDGQTIATGLVFAFFMGAVGGIIPSLFAMIQNPLESMR